MMHLKIVGTIAFVLGLAPFAFAGGEVGTGSGKKEYRELPPDARPPAPAPRPAAAPKGRSLMGDGIRVYSGNAVRNQPMPAPFRAMGVGKEYHDFYGPTYYYPSEHNVYEGLHPQYYPFINQKSWPNYKAPADYCAGKICGPSSSMYYWDSYDDWKRGERYEQHQ